MMGVVFLGADHRQLDDSCMYYYPSVSLSEGQFYQPISMFNWRNKNSNLPLTTSLQYVYVALTTNVK